MDTSAEYIKMCGISPIQDYWQPQNADIVKGDFVGYIKNWGITQGHGNASLERVSNDKESCGKDAWYNKCELIWLPRQDQLQKMLEAVHNNYIAYCDYICHFSEKFEGFRTPEQIMLINVMEEKHSKMWSNEKWVKA